LGECRRGISNEAAADILRSSFGVLVAPPFVIAVASRSEASQARKEPADFFSDCTISTWLSGLALSAPPVIKQRVDFADVNAQIDRELSSPSASLKPDYVN
jgi:hypothetical protein